MSEGPGPSGEDAEFTLLTREELTALVRDRTDTLENVMNTMVDVLVTLDAEGRITLANAAVETKLGYDPEAVTGEPIDRLLAEEGGAGVEAVGDGEFVRLLVGEGRVTDAEVAFRTQSGDIVPMSLSASVMRDEEGIEAIVCVAKDISERKATEQRAEFLHSLLRHDLGNKLQQVSGYHELLAETPLSETQQEYLDRARRGISSSDTLLEKVRMLTRLDTDEEAEVVSLSEHVRMAVAQHTDLASERGIDIHPPEDINVEVVAGPLLTEVLANIIENSIKHSNGSRIELEVVTDADSVTVVVSDDGDGIPPAEREQIRKRGYHGGDSTSSGLGMYIVSEVTAFYDGTLEIGASDAGGARFALTFDRPQE